jgi:signal transduction histidine kinase
VYGIQHFPVRAADVEFHAVAEKVELSVALFIKDVGSDQFYFPDSELTLAAVKHCVIVFECDTEIIKLRLSVTCRKPEGGVFNENTLPYRADYAVYNRRSLADDLFAVWLIANLIFIPAAMYALIALCRLRQGAQHLAQGDLSYRVDEQALLGAFRRHGEDLNSIREGINHAVEKRLQSERFRTELITNVSHDIKTPLTSLINYIDLLQKELEELILQKPHLHQGNIL